MNDQSPKFYDEWKECTAPFWRGRTFYRKINIPNEYYYGLKFVNDGKVVVEIFDPNFLFKSEKSLTLPRLYIKLKRNTDTWINIKVEKMHNLPLNQDCIASLQYSFTSCIEVGSEV